MQLHEAPWSPRTSLVVVSITVGLASLSAAPASGTHALHVSRNIAVQLRSQANMETMADTRSCLLTVGFLRELI